MSMNTVEDLRNAPYIKVMTWMTDGLRLKGNALTAFSLLFEREHSGDVDTARIDAGYLSEAMGTSPAETFQVLSDLVKKGLVKPDFNGGDFLTAFKVDTDNVMAALSGGTHDTGGDDHE